MRVLFLTRWYPSADEIYSGTFVREHAKAVRALGHEVRVLHLVGTSPRQRGTWRLERELDPQLTEGIETWRVMARSVPGASFASSTWAAVRATRRVRELGFDPDIVHAHVFTAGVPAVMVGRLFRRPVIVTEHSTDFIERTLGRVALLKARFAFSGAARVLPVSAHLRDAIEAYGLHGRFSVVPNAVDPAIFHPAAGSPTARDGGRVLFVGHLDGTPRKGFPTLLAALTRLRSHRRDWHLDVVGGGPGLEEQRRGRAASDLAGFVDFHGPLPKGRVAALMRESDIFVLPSRFENLPCVIIEAMASGLPILSTWVGGIPEMVTDREGVLVPPDDVEALEAALDRMLSGSAAYDRPAIAARAVARYGLATVGAALQEIYVDAAGKGRGPG